MFKAISMLILTGIIVPIIAWAGVQLFEHATRLTKVESDYGHIKESLTELKTGQRDQNVNLNEIRSYIIKNK